MKHIITQNSTNHVIICIFTLLLSAFSINSFAQDAEGLKILKKFFIEENAGYKTIQTDTYPYSADFDDEGDPFSIEYEFLGYQDLNGDTIKDLVFQRISSGQLGGNVHSNSSIVWYLLDKTGEKKQYYEVLTYAPFSYNILDGISFKNGKVYTNATKNFRTYYEEKDRDDSCKLIFEFKDGLLYEHSYLIKCKMAEMKDKHIFKPTLSGVKIEANIDEHNYVSGMHETYTEKGTRYNANLYGCDNLTLILSSENKGFIKNEQQFIAENLTFFMNNTRYKTILGKIFEYTQSKAITTGKLYELGDNWDFKINIDKSRKGKVDFNLIVEKDYNENQSENWDITTRRK